MGGDGRTAVEAAEKLAGIVSERAKREVPWTQPIAAAPYVAHARFSAPDAVLALPAPADGFPYVRGHWHEALGPHRLLHGSPAKDDPLISFPAELWARTLAARLRPPAPSPTSRCVCPAPQER